MTPRERLFQWISGIYQDRTVKISGEPYLEHLVFVAEFAKDAVPLGYEIGLCHDLLEDTHTYKEELEERLTELGYNDSQAVQIAAVVSELTTFYTKVVFAHLSKKERHRLEDHRLSDCSGAAQTVKYGDLIYNGHWTMLNEPRKLRQYVISKLSLLNRLDKGDADLKKRAEQLLLSL